MPEYSGYNPSVAVLPVGAIIPWAKTLTGTPGLSDNFMECDGSAVTDADSVFYGQNVPNLNGNNYFLRANTSSGGTGNNFHQHNLNINTSSVCPASSNGVNACHTHNVNGSVGSPTVSQEYYDIVFIIRIK